MLACPVFVDLLGYQALVVWWVPGASLDPKEATAFQVLQDILAILVPRAPTELPVPPDLLALVAISAQSVLRVPRVLAASVALEASLAQWACKAKLVRSGSPAKGVP